MSDSPLRALRLARDLTQPELAELTGVSVNTISRIEHGHTLPNGRSRIRLARFFGIDPAELAPYERDESGAAA